MYVSTPLIWPTGRALCSAEHLDAFHCAGRVVLYTKQSPKPKCCSFERELFLGLLWQIMYRSAQQYRTIYSTSLAILFPGHMAWKTPAIPSSHGPHFLSEAANHFPYSRSRMHWRFPYLMLGEKTQGQTRVFVVLWDLEVGFPSRIVPQLPGMKAKGSCNLFPGFYLTKLSLYCGGSQKRKNN